MAIFFGTSNAPRFGALAATVALSLSVIGAAGAQAPVSADLQRLLATPSWQLDCQVTFTAAGSGALPNALLGPLTYTHTLSREHTASYLIGLRTEGPSLSMTKVMANMSGPGAAAAQKAMMDLIAQTDTITSWISSPPELPENLSDEQQLAAMRAYVTMPIGNARVDFVRTTRGDLLHDETGRPFKQTTRTTRSGTIKVVGGGAQMNLEINAGAKRVALMLPADYVTEDGAKISEETITVTESPPGSAPQETRERKDNAADFPGHLTMTDASGKGIDVLMIDDPFTVVGGKISGTRTVDASYTLDGNTVPGKLVARYTLTPH